jgi:hypothetical protein
MGAYDVISRALQHKTKTEYYEGRKWQAEYVKENDKEYLELYHYGTMLVKVDVNTGKIVNKYLDGWSMSDKYALSVLSFALRNYKKVELEDYEFIRNRLIHGERLRKIREFREKFRKSLFKKVRSYPDAIPYIQKLGFVIEYIENEKWKEFCEKNGFRAWNYMYDTWVLFIRPNILAIRYYAQEDDSKIALTHSIKKLNGVVILKTAYFEYYENYNDFYIKDVRLIGKDETNQLWSLRLPVNYYLASIEKSEEWVMGLNNLYEVVEEQ